MDKQTNTGDCIDETGLHLPLGQLFYLLHSNGFRVKPDDYIEMLKITERFGSKNIDDTARWICPIIATTEIEQERFYNVIDQYKKLAIASSCEEPEVVKPVPRWVKIASAVLLALLLVLTIFFSVRGKARLMEEDNKERTVEKGSPLNFDASNLLRDKPSDSAYIKFAWKFEDSSRQQGLRVAHLFKTPGDYFVQRQFSSATIPLAKAADSLLVHVCNDLPKVNINIPAEAVAVQQPVTITAGIDAEPGTVSYFQWKIRDSVFKTNAPVVQNFIFYKEGDYTVECKAVVGSVSSPCTASDNKIIQVLDNGLHYSALFSAGKPNTYTVATTPKWWVTLILLLPAAAGLLYSLFKRKQKRSAAPEKPAAEKAAPNGPYEIPFEQNDVKLIQQERELRSTFIQMRYKSEEETLALNVQGTILSIIRSGGSPQLVFAPVSRPQQYLILIDQSNPKSMLTRFFNYVVKTIMEDCIPVMVFYYDKNFVCYNNHFPSGQPLQKLADTQSHTTLLILGKAHELVYNVYPVIEEKFLRELNRWQSKAIVTPVPVKDWAAREKVLQEFFVLVPADVMALQKLIPALREKTKIHDTLLEITDKDQYSIKDVDFRDVNELRHYLNEDEVLFQWLCAICVYPRLRWEIVVEIGKAILDKYGQPENLNYTNLLKVCRISWMQQGVFPQATRFELLKFLKVDNELCARETLLKMLNYSTLVYGDKEHRFEEEKKRQQLTNQFILHASDHELYNRYADSKEAFKKLWKSDAILDVPLKKYLDKTPKDNWKTPVSNGSKSVGLSEYFNLQDIRLNKHIRFRRALVGIAAVLLIAVWTYIGFFGGSQIFEPALSLSQLKSEPFVPFEIKMIRNFSHCGDSLKKTFGKLDGYLEIDKNKIPLSYNADNATVSFKVPYKSYLQGNGNMMFTWDSNKSVIIPFNFKTMIPDSATVSCISIRSRPVLHITYNDSAGYSNMESTINNLLYDYSITTNQQDFTDSSRILYYNAGDKAEAGTIAQRVKQGLGINIKESLAYANTKAISASSSEPVLFLNTGGTTVAESNDYKTSSTDEGDTYHRMADQDFADKKYMQAIQGYGRALAMNPKDALAYYQRGLCYEMLGDSYADNAIEEYTAAIRLNAKDALSFYRRASVKYGLKKYADAVTDFSRVISINSANAKQQTSYSVFYRGKSYYFLNNLTSACQDFKASADLGVAAGQQEYKKYCLATGTDVKADCEKIFYSMKQALAVDARVVCKLDLSKENISTLPSELYTFKNLTELNLGTTSIPVNDIAQLQKTLSNCKITYTARATQADTDLGYINLDEKGNPDAAGLQLIATVGEQLRNQPEANVRLAASYAKSFDGKMVQTYLDNIMKMFEPYMTNQKAPVQQSAPANSTKSSAGVIRVHVLGVNFKPGTSDSKY